MSSRHFQSFAAIALFALVATPAEAATCSVPATHATITLALADASCDTIQVAAGTYVENIVIPRSLTLEGAGQGATIIDGNASGRVVDVGPGLTVVMRDLTVRNGRLDWDNGAGIRNGSTNSPRPGEGSHLTLTRVTVTGNRAGDGFGGGILNNRYSTLVVEHSTISANQARDGGGLGNVIDAVATINDSVIGGPVAADGNVGGSPNYRGFGGGINNSDGTVHVNRSVIRNNRTTGVYGPGPGGGICNDQTNGFPVLTVTDSTISDNYGSNGGAIAGDGFRGSITVNGSTLSGNTADAYFGNGGAIWLYNGHGLTMTNSTISGNRVNGGDSAIGAGIGTIALYNSTYDTIVTLTNVTITNNQAVAPNAGAAGIGRQSGVKFRIQNSIISGNTATSGSAAAVAADCGGSEVQSLGHNIFGQDGSANGCPADGSTDIVPAPGALTSAIIGPLADNGGHTWTHEPLFGGIAVDAANDAVAPATDQIGTARPFGDHADIGAVELAFNTAPTAAAGGPYTVAEGGSVALSGSGTDAEQDSASLAYAWDLDNDGTFETAGQAAMFSAASIDGPASVTVRLQVCDEMGECAVSEAAVNVVNAAPTVTAAGSTIDEGGTAMVSGSLADAGAADTHTVVIGWGGSTTTLTLASGQTSFSASRSFADDGVHAVSISVTDDEGGSSSASATVRVNNVAPTVTASGAATALAGQPYTLTGTFADPGVADTFTLTINWGDGTETMAVSGGTFSATHQFTSAGARTISACVADDDGGSNCATVNVTVALGAGKVTGGGLRTANNGRGGFNVQSNGSTVTGELQFQSSLGSFHASTFTSLAVSSDGRTATFSGIGRDGRAFTAYVEDNGEPGRNDVFRLWIGGVLQNGSGAMSGGNVQIHR